MSHILLCTYVQYGMVCTHTVACKGSLFLGHQSRQLGKGENMQRVMMDTTEGGDGETTFHFDS